MALLGDPGQLPPSSLGSLPAQGSLFGDTKGSHGAQPGLQLEGVEGSAWVGSSCPPPPQAPSRAQCQIKGTQH